MNLKLWVPLHFCINIQKHEAYKFTFIYKTFVNYFTIYKNSISFTYTFHY